MNEPEANKNQGIANYGNHNNKVYPVNQGSNRQQLLNPNDGATPMQQQGQYVPDGQQRNLNIQHPNTRGIEQKQIKDFSQPPAGFVQPLYDRDIIPENAENNEELGGAYQKYLYNCGDFWGSIKSVCPCFVPCVDYPYIQVDQSFVGLRERFGKYVNTVKPGLIYVNPCTDKLITIDCKTQLIDCPRQWVMTKDNILVSIDATVYYKVVTPRRSYYYINNLHQSVTQLTLATIKTISGSYTLQDLLEKRKEISAEIEQFVDINVWDWGIDVEQTLIKDIQLNKELQETLSLTAKEQRAAQAKVIQAQADVQSAKLMQEAANFLDSKAAMQIRYLETISILGRQLSTKVVFLPEDN